MLTWLGARSAVRNEHSLGSRTFAPQVTCLLVEAGLAGVGGTASLAEKIQRPKWA